MSRPPPDAAFWRSAGWWRRTASTSLGTTAFAAFGFGTTVVAARGLGATEYGRVVIALATVTLITMMLDLTLEEAIVHHGFRLIEQERLPALAGLFWSALLIDVAVGVAVVSGIAVLAPHIEGPLGLGGEGDLLIRVAAFGALGATAEGSTSAVLLLERRTDVRAACMAVGAACKLVLVAFVATTSAVGVLWAMAVGSWLAAGLQFLVVMRVLRHSFAIPTRRELRQWLRPLFAFGIHSSVTSSITAGKDAAIPILIGMAAGPAAAARFAVAALPLLVAAVASSPIRLMLFPEHALLHAAGDTATLRRSIVVYTRIGLPLAALGAIAGWFALPGILHWLYPPGFAGAVPAARVMLIPAAVHVILAWSKALPAAIGRPEMRTRIAAVDLVAILLVAWILREQGAMAGATAIAAGSLILVGVWIWVTRRLFADSGGKR